MDAGFFGEVGHVATVLLVNRFDLTSGVAKNYEQMLDVIYGRPQSVNF